MTQFTDKERADEIRHAVEVLNDILHRAAENGVAVYMNVQEVAVINGTPRLKLLNVTCSKVL